MKHILRLTALLFAVAVSVIAQTGPMPDTPWFDHVTEATALSEAALGELAQKTYAGLKSGLSLKELTALAPEEHKPRVIFISIGGMSWPGRTYFGTGYSFATAWANVMDILLANEKVYAVEAKKEAEANIRDTKAKNLPVTKAQKERLADPAAWNWLRLDIVQAAQPAVNFSPDSSIIAMTSLAGLAFGPDVGYAFTPAQLSGRFMMTDSHTLNKVQVGNIIAETFNLGALQAWMKVANAEGGQRICLFECDSYFTEGGPAKRLYRTHSKPALPLPEQCLAMATACGKQLCANIDKENGQFLRPFPEWFFSAKEKEEPAMLAELVLALARLSEVTQDATYSDTALFVTRALMRSIVKLGENSENSVLTEPEPLPEGSSQDPRPIAKLRTNAMACLALSAMAHVRKTTEFDATRFALARYVLAQYQEGLGFVQARHFPSGQLYTEEEISLYGEVEAEAIAITAVQEVSRQLHNGEFQLIADSVLEDFLENRLRTLSIEEVQMTPWLAEALSQHYSRGSDNREQMARLSLLAPVSANLNPLFPDLFGSPVRLPSCTTAAEFSLLLMKASSWFRKIGKTAEAKEAFQGALPFILYQTSGYMDLAAAHAMASPESYIGFFRDNVEAFGFDLGGQTTQIFSLLALREELMALGDGQYPEHKALQDKLEALWKTWDVHPTVLTAGLVTNDMVGLKTRETAGDVSLVSEKTYQFKGDKNDRPVVSNDVSIESRVLKKRTKATSTKP